MSEGDPMCKQVKVEMEGDVRVTVSRDGCPEHPRRTWTFGADIERSDMELCAAAAKLYERAFPDVEGTRTADGAITGFRFHVQRIGSAAEAEAAEIEREFASRDRFDPKRAAVLRAEVEGLLGDKPEDDS